MRSRTAEWFETKVKYDKMMEDGSQKKVPELYVVDALSFTEAEEAVTEEAAHFSTGEFDVTDIKKAPYHEIFFSDNPSDDKWYKSKVQFIILDEKTGKEKLSGVNYLVQSNSLQNAVKNIEEVLNSGMQDWKIASIAETSILDVYEHQIKSPAGKEQPTE
ncbi:MAG: DUF4494 domain-containing protein [Prevotella sp.]|nr:DUF4494 domain-containing protein [Prevotella sp.]MBQ9561188.1 DUF4494 domain-containing protein [Prevotella sp.]MBR1839133.1 DUF4494 domain-containing protein [Prevotella sp.]